MANLTKNDGYFKIDEKLAPMDIFIGDLVVALVLLPDGLFDPLLEKWQFRDQATVI